MFKHESRLKYIVFEYSVALIFIVSFLSCSAPVHLVPGNYYSQGEYIIESKHTDVWRSGHYLLTIDSSNAFVLKEVSYMVGARYTVCSGNLQCQGHNSYSLIKTKKEYPYGVLGNPYYNDNNYRIIIKNKETIILKRGQWKTILQFITQDSIPSEFSFPYLEINTR